MKLSKQVEVQRVLFRIFCWKHLPGFLKLEDGLRSCVRGRNEARQVKVVKASRCVAKNYVSTGGRDAPDNGPRSPKDRQAQQTYRFPTTSTLPTLPTLDDSGFGGIDHHTAVISAIPT